MAVQNPTSPSHSHSFPTTHNNQFFVWREFLWGGIAGGFGEGMMHPVDTIKTRIQTQSFLLSGTQQSQKSILQMVRAVHAADGVRGFYRGVSPGVTGSLATGATYFGFIESTKKWIEESHPNLGGHWAHFIAGAVGDTLGSVVYVPCEVIKQRMQLLYRNVPCWKINIKGARAKRVICWVMFYEALKDLSEYGKKKWIPSLDDFINSSMEGLVLGGLAGGFSAYLTTPLDVIKTRLQVQGSTIRYNGWLDAMKRIWKIEGVKGMFRGSIPRITWYIPASALTFMAVEFLRDQFNEKNQEVTNLSVEKKGSSLREVA
ncbi:S-adenosylmethionine mitochondrial carrier protein isoform X3 [Ricinus communis]|uniref:S-adenosylmethionine mitochondrial carrier protein isoform X3 n=1 Tax=Ricinus communis TaxID=3988 RepID=UPI00201A915C|nr:S-adenosylmethionine mitochondrial carrier protein isoform X3 [Ricinus communis]